MPIGLKKTINSGSAQSTTTDSADMSEAQGVTDDTQLDDIISKSKMSKKSIAIVGITAGVLVLGLVGAFSGISNKRNSNAEPDDVLDFDSAINSDDTVQPVDAGIADESGDTANSTSDVYDADGKTIDPNGINPGITDYKHSTNNQVSPYVYNESDYIKDLNGLDVSAVYNVASTDYVVDYVSYETRRAIIDDGMEMYWLEVKYSGKKYRVQVPFYYFKDLGKEGICKVEMEVLTLVGGGKIISYMEVVDDNYTGRQ